MTVATNMHFPVAIAAGADQGGTMFNNKSVLTRAPEPNAAKRPAPAPLPASTSQSSSGSSFASDPSTDFHSALPVPSAPRAPAEAAAAPAPNDSGSRLIVGPNVKLKGAEILDCDTLVVEGRVEATMDSRVLTIAERGSFCGKVGIDVAEIHGDFEGDLTARQQLVIHATGRVKGKIRYGKLLIESGGLISGDVESLSESRIQANSDAQAAASAAAAAAPGNVKPLVSSSAG